MHILTAVALTLGALAILVVGLIRVLHDLLERGPYDAPLMEDPARERQARTMWHAKEHPDGNECCR